MKKVYLLALGLMTSVGLMAQTSSITLTDHFSGSLANPSAPSIGLFTWGTGNGYVSGTNTFGDKAIVQKFDSIYGVDYNGTIDSVKVMIPFKSDGGGEFQVAVWEDNNGAPGSILGSVTVDIANVDTTQAGTKLIMDGPTTVVGIYNLSVAFTSAISIPANHTFWAGVILPTTAAAGDTIAVLTTMPISIGGTYDFVDAATHAGAIDVSDAFASYSVSSLDAANAIFPVITPDLASTTANVLAKTVAYPNPTTSVLNIKFATDKINSVNVVSLTGQVVGNANVIDRVAHVNVSDLNSGVYFYQAIDIDGTILLTKKFVKK